MTLAQKEMMTTAEAHEAAAEIRKATETFTRDLGKLRVLALDFHERKGWAALGYNTIEACAKNEFGWSRRQFYHQLTAGKIEESAGIPVGTTPERRARRPAVKPQQVGNQVHNSLPESCDSANNGNGVEAPATEAPREELAPEPVYPEHGVLVDEPFAPLGEPGTSATAFNTDLPTDDDPAPLCHNCGEPVPEGVEDGLPVICDTCAPGYYQEPSPVAEKGPMPSPWGEGDRERRAEAAGGAPRLGRWVLGPVAETVGSGPPVVSDLSKPGRDSDASSPDPHHRDGAKHETAEASCSSAAIEDDEEWLVGLLERRWLLENGLPTPKLVRLARIVTARAGDSTRAGMAARAMLAEAKE